MMPSSRIWCIYRKELIEILRDHRTLVAMIVVPVVLYPLMMLGFVWAAQRDEEQLTAGTYVIEVDTEAGRDALSSMLDQAQATGRVTEARQAQYHVRTGSTAPAELGDEVQLRAVWQDTTQSPQPGDQVGFTLYFNEINTRSRIALVHVKSLLREYERLLSRNRVAMLLRTQAGREVSESELDAVLHPVVIEQETSATDRQRGGWALGQVIPIILVLMTITGAIYPAIDLTAGERERGTLETLMVSPVPTLHLILGKFFVVVTLSLMSAALNIGSVGATMHFGGLTRSLTQEMPVELPLAVLPVVLLCMVPFTLLFSAILLAVSSFARTFKEAQSYVMPVIILAMIPAVTAALPGTQLKGMMLVIPVGNMVLLTRELFQNTYTWTQILIVLLSTSLYASAAIAAATRLFGQEAVLFTDAVAYKALLHRRNFRPQARPAAALALVLAALLFPATFYAQGWLGDTEHFIRTLTWLAGVQFFGLFVLMPVALSLYLKIDVVETFRLRLPRPAVWVAALLIGCSTWALALQLAAWQQRFFPPSRAMQELNERIQTQLADSPVWLALLLLAVTPALAEEFFFRGFLLSGVSTSLKKGSAIVTVGLIFGVYHFMLERLAVTALLGIALAYIAWQGRSLWPCVLVHAMHNGLALALGTRPELSERLGLDAARLAEGAPLPLHVLLPALMALGLGLLLLRNMARTTADSVDNRDGRNPTALV